jgi:hypothetical protein
LTSRGGPNEIVDAIGAGPGASEKNNRQKYQEEGFHGFLFLARYAESFREYFRKIPQKEREDNTLSLVAEKPSASIDVNRWCGN